MDSDSDSDKQKSPSDSGLCHPLCQCEKCRPEQKVRTSFMNVSVESSHLL